MSRAKSVGSPQIPIAAKFHSFRLWIPYGDSEATQLSNETFHNIKNKTNKTSTSFPYINPEDVTVKSLPKNNLRAGRGVLFIPDPNYSRVLPYFESIESAGDLITIYRIIIAHYFLAIMWSSNSTYLTGFLIRAFIVWYIFGLVYKMSFMLF